MAPCLDSSATPAVSNGAKAAGSSSADPVMPIAIVGIAGRFPGEASTPQKLWDMISKGGNAPNDVPKDRFNIDAFWHPHHERQGTMSARGGYFLEGDVAGFDAPFFSIKPEVADSMDPQQRMAMECAYETFENAGIPIEKVAGSNTACFVGAFGTDYLQMLYADPDNLPLYAGTVIGKALLANRISHFFDLTGPSVSVDTACSSSMVSLHLGCQSIRTGEAEMALVGGVNALLMPDLSISMSSMHFLSPDGVSKSFDKDANGYARGEGAAFVLLKPLDLALRDGDTIRAVIRNSGVNSDGKTLEGITVPSQDAQAALIRNVYETAGLSLKDTLYVEAHGTGTPKGDPIEAEALARTFGHARPAHDPLLVGSIKQNIGHLEGAASLTSLIKAVYMLERAVIPPNTRFREANPNIPLDKWNLKIPVENLPWPSDGPRRISVNSFGYGGANAHVIVDDAGHYLISRGLVGKHHTSLTHDPSTGQAAANSAASEIDILGNGTAVDGNGSNGTAVSGTASKGQLDGQHPSISFDESSTPIISTNDPRLFVYSSTERSGIERVGNTYSQFVSEQTASAESLHDQEFLQSLSDALATRRSIFPWKSFAVAATVDELSTGFKSPSVDPVRSNDPPRVAFIFTGQGAQWYAMGRELIRYQVFRQSLVAATKYFTMLGCQWSLLEELWRSEDTSKINSPEFSQGITTALQVALVELLQAWGVAPACVVGHSSGEIAAAYAKGAISRESAWTIGYHRGRLANALASKTTGAMLATLDVGEQQAREHIEKVTQGTAVIACINSPSSVTISGDVTAVEEVQSLISAAGQTARRLKVNIAYHSPHMKAIADQLADSAKNCLPQVDRGENVIMFSSVTGKPIHTHGLTPEYWVTNLLSPVNFVGALTSLCQHSNGNSSSSQPYASVFVEVGPHAALEGPTKKTLQELNATDFAYTSMLVRKKDARVTALQTAGRLFQHGCPINLEEVNACGTRQTSNQMLVDLPSYPWNHSNKYWPISEAVNKRLLRDRPRTDLLGSRIPDGINLEPRWRNFLRKSEVPWVAMHQVQGSILYPATGMIVTAIEAIREEIGAEKDIDGYELKNISIHRPIVIPDSGTDGVETILCFKERQGTDEKDIKSSWREFALHSRSGESWVLNCEGLIRVAYNQAPNSSFSDEKTILNAYYKQKYKDIKSDCTKYRQKNKFYEDFANVGMEYEGVFQSVTEVHKGHFQAVGVVEIPDTKTVMPESFEYDHVIHPATLDCICQIGFPASTSIDKWLHVGYVTRHIDEIYVSAKVPNAPGVRLHGYAVEKGGEGSASNATFIVSTEEWDRPLVSVKGFRSTPLPESEQALANASRLRKLATHLHWQDDIDFMDMSAVKKYCQEACADQDVIDASNVADLELMSFVYMKRILTAFTPEQAEEFPTHLRKYYSFMQEIMNRVTQGKIRHQSIHPELDWLNVSEQQEKDLIQAVSNASPDGAVVCKHGELLLDIMRGIESPQRMFEDDKMDKLYRSGIGCTQMQVQLARYVDLLAHKHPNLKLLEIGGGTGGTTLPVLETIGGKDGKSIRFSSYTFTDLSTAFFEKAQEKFHPWASNMDYSKLDIEQDPITQGFEEGGYDIILASNVLHVAQDMGTVLANVRKLLKPGGQLILVEITNTLLRFHMIVGSFDQWWAAKDSRMLGPLMTETEWNRLLSKQDLGGISIALRDSDDPFTHAYSIMVATVPTPSLTNGHKETSDNFMIVKPETSLEHADEFIDGLAKQLQPNAANVEVCTLQQASVADLAQKSCILALECAPNQRFLQDLGEEQWNQVKKIIQNARRILWLTNGAIDGTNPSSSLITGLSRVIRSENPTISISTLDMDPDTSINSSENIALAMDVLKASKDEVNSSHPEWEYAIRHGKLMVPRLLLDSGMNGMTASLFTTPEPALVEFDSQTPLKLAIEKPGKLETLMFVEDSSFNNALGPMEIEIQVKSTGLSSRDSMIVMGQLDGHKDLGVDASGIVTRTGGDVSKFKQGDRVMTWCTGSVRTYVRSTESLCFLIPAGMSFSTAASLPFAYCTAYLAIFDAARLQKSDSVLIHNAAGVVGQAAIQLARYIGSEIFATTSSIQRKQFLMKEYGIPESHIFNSRDDGFAEVVMRMTLGRGVDVVLNTLVGEARQKSLQCMARFGRFIELDHVNKDANTQFEITPLHRSIMFQSIDSSEILKHDISRAERIFQSVTGLIEQELIQPTSLIQAMPLSRAEEGFRLMQTGNHFGKIVLEQIDGDLVYTAPKKAKEASFNPMSTYILAGGSGGIGRSIALWMVEHGAKHLVFLSPSGTDKPQMKELIERLSNRGVKCVAYKCDIGNSGQLEATLKECASTFPPIRGVIQAAMVLKDSIYQNMTYDQYRVPLNPKINGTWNLYQYLPKDIDFFIMLSSVAGIVGTRSQSNYAAGNSYQDSMALHLRRNGIPASSIILGAVQDVGYVASNRVESQLVADTAMQWDHVSIRESELHAVLQAAITGESFQGEKSPAQIVLGLGTGGMAQHANAEFPKWWKDRKFACIREADMNQVSNNNDSTNTVRLRDQVADPSLSLDSCTSIIGQAFIQKLAKQMMTDAENFEISKSLVTYGVDSLMAVEIMSWFYEELQVRVKVFELMSDQPISVLASKIAQEVLQGGSNGVLPAQT